MSQNSSIPAAIKLIQPAGALYRYLPGGQRAALVGLLTGEEGEHFGQVLQALAERIATMPVCYDQDGKGDTAIVYLHYFSGGADFWITEKDLDGRVDQAFGLARLHGNDPGLGYISIREITRAGVELDLYWEPVRLGEVRAKIGR